MHVPERLYRLHQMAERITYPARCSEPSLVDSVLADMRPKIVGEIARKLGKKK